MWQPCLAQPGLSPTHTHTPNPLHHLSQPAGGAASSSSSGSKHVIALHDSFKLGEHLCLVMEAMNMSLRRVLKVYGAGQGVAVKAVSGGGRAGRAGGRAGGRE